MIVADQFLEPIPRAIEYLRRSRLPDGRLARFYELKTNKPLYLTRGDYQLTYSDANMPTHYSFKQSDRTGSIAREYERLMALDPDELRRPAEVVSCHSLTASVCGSFARH
jgi:hypothetical protein